MGIAFCIVASKNVLPELKLLCQSIKAFVRPVPPLYVLWRGEQAEDMPLAIYHYVSDSFDLKKVGGDKSQIITIALSEHPKALYLDCDVLFLGGWTPDLEPDAVTFSRHMTNNEGAVGKFNSGFIGVSTLRFPLWWNLQPKEVPGHYGDQQCLDQWHTTGKQYEFPEQCNVGWWRLWDALKYAPTGFRVAAPECFRMKLDGGTILYNDAPLICVHSHFMKLPGYSPNNVPLSLTFNRIVLDHLQRSRDTRHHNIHQTIIKAGANL